MLSRRIMSWRINVASFQHLSWAGGGQGNKNKDGRAHHDTQKVFTITEELFPT